GLGCEVLGGMLRAPRDVEVTRAGEIVVSEFGAGRLVRLRAGAWETIADGLAGPIGVREWRDGRLLVGEEHAQAVSWIGLDDGAHTPLAEELGNVTYVALDDAGALFVSTFVAGTRGAGVVHRIDPGSGAVAPFATGLDVPEGLFVDADGALFVAEWDTPSSVRRFPPGGGDVAASEIVADGFDRIYGLLPDGDGGFFAGDHAGRIVRVRAGGDIERIVDGIGRPGGLARDATGALLVAEFVDFGAEGRVLRVTGL
nr:hypothetical protein [Myxococcota bacterium]